MNFKYPQFLTFAGLLLLFRFEVALCQFTVSITNKKSPGPPPIPYRSGGQELDIGSRFYMRRGATARIIVNWSIEGVEVDEEALIEWFYSETASSSRTRIDFSTNPSFINNILIFQSTNFPNIYRSTSQVNSQTLINTNIQDENAGFYCAEVSVENSQDSECSEILLPILPSFVPSINVPTDTSTTDFDDFFNSIGIGISALCDKSVGLAVSCDGTLPLTISCDEGASQTFTSEAISYAVNVIVPRQNAQVEKSISCNCSNSYGDDLKAVPISFVGVSPSISCSTSDLNCAPRGTFLVEADCPQTACVLEFGRVVLRVTVPEPGLPSNTVRRWFKSGTPPRELLAGTKYTFDKVGNIERLTIDTIAVVDEGMYFMTIENCAGIASTQGLVNTVRVFSEPVIQVSGLLVIPSDSCENDNRFTTVNLREQTLFGSTGISDVCLTCPSTGREPPTFTWTRDGTLINNANRSFLAIGGSAVGVYSCVAQNLAGEDNSAVIIQRDDLRYSYEFSSCDKTCGGGIQSPNLVCFKIDENGNDVKVPNAECENSNLDVPIQPPNRQCNVIDCPLMLVPQEFGTCSVTCGEGIQSRIYGCEQIKSTGRVQQLSLSVCLEAGLFLPDIPETQRCVISGVKIKNTAIDSCASADDFEYRPVLEWSECTKTCHEGRRYRRISCFRISTNLRVANIVCKDFNIEEIPEVETCGAGPCGRTTLWLCGGWSSCSATCGKGVQVRDIICYDALTRSTSDECQVRKPISFRECVAAPCFGSDGCVDNYSFCGNFIPSAILCQDPNFIEACCATCNSIQ